MMNTPGLYYDKIMWICKNVIMIMSICYTICLVLINGAQCNLEWFSYVLYYGKRVVHHLSHQSNF